MIASIKQTWGGFVRPLLQRPKGLQVAALCYRNSGEKTQVLLITSRDTGRWIIPKGWPMRGMASAEAAKQEAWEEAGVAKAKLGRKPIGTYTYEKVKSTGWTQPVETLVFPLAVKELADDFPEADQRQRKWVSPKKAAKLVDEPGLQSILLSL